MSEKNTSFSTKGQKESSFRTRKNHPNPPHAENKKFSYIRNLLDDEYDKLLQDSHELSGAIQAESSSSSKRKLSKIFFGKSRAEREKKLDLKLGSFEKQRKGNYGGGGGRDERQLSFGIKDVLGNKSRAKNGRRAEQDLEHGRNPMKQSRGPVLKNRVGIGLEEVLFPKNSKKNYNKAGKRVVGGKEKKDMSHSSNKYLNVSRGRKGANMSQGKVGGLLSGPPITHMDQFMNQIKQKSRKNYGGVNKRAGEVGEGREAPQRMKSSTNSFYGKKKGKRGKVTKSNLNLSKEKLHQTSSETNSIKMLNSKKRFLSDLTGEISQPAPPVVIRKERSGMMYKSHDSKDFEVTTAKTSQAAQNSTISKAEERKNSSFSVISPSPRLEEVIQEMKSNMKDMNSILGSGKSGAAGGGGHSSSHNNSSLIGALSSNGSFIKGFDQKRKLAMVLSHQPKLDKSYGSTQKRNKHLNFGAETDGRDIVMPPGGHEGRGRAAEALKDLMSRDGIDYFNRTSLKKMKHKRKEKYSKNSSVSNRFAGGDGYAPKSKQNSFKSSIGKSGISAQLSSSKGISGGKKLSNMYSSRKKMSSKPRIDISGSFKTFKPESAKNTRLKLFNFGKKQAEFDKKELKSRSKNRNLSHRKMLLTDIFGRKSSKPGGKQKPKGGSEGLERHKKREERELLDTSGDKSRRYLSDLDNSGFSGDLEDDMVPASVVRQGQGLVSPRIGDYVKNFNFSYYMRDLRKACSGVIDQNSSFVRHIHQNMKSVQLMRRLLRSSDKVFNYQDKIFEAPPFLKNDKSGKSKFRRTVLFDLDETLVHCDLRGDLRRTSSSMVIMITLPNKEKVKAHVNIRPYAKTLLRNMSKHFEVGIFTASHSCYAEEVVNNLDPKREFISMLLTRKNCVEVDTSVFVKDLRIIQGRNINDILLIDNAAYSYGLQLDNGIPCIPFYDNPDDTELIKLESYLLDLASFHDMIQFNKSYFRSYLFSEFSQIKPILEAMLEED